MTLVICGTYTHASVSILKHATETVIVLNVNPAKHEHGVIVIVSALMLFPSLNEWWESRNLTFNDHRDIKTAYMESPVKSEKKHFSLFSEIEVQNTFFPLHGHTVSQPLWNLRTGHAAKQDAKLSWLCSWLIPSKQQMNISYPRKKKKSLRFTQCFSFVSVEANKIKKNN